MLRVSRSSFGSLRGPPNGGLFLCKIRPFGALGNGVDSHLGACIMAFALVDGAFLGPLTGRGTLTIDPHKKASFQKVRSSGAAKLVFFLLPCF